MLPALRLLAGDRDPELLDALAHDLARWARQEPQERPISLHRYMRLPSPASTRLALRDALLRHAAGLLPAATLGGRARLLAGEVALLDRKWAVWRDLPSAPAHAPEVLRVLWAARRWGRLPGTARMLTDIIATRERLCAGDFIELGSSLPFIEQPEIPP
jgi:hypothetical protein